MGQLPEGHDTARRGLETVDAADVPEVDWVSISQSAEPLSPSPSDTNERKATAALSDWPDGADPEKLDVPAEHSLCMVLDQLGTRSARSLLSVSDLAATDSSAPFGCDSYRAFRSLDTPGAMPASANATWPSQSIVKLAQCLPVSVRIPVEVMSCRCG